MLSLEPPVFVVDVSNVSCYVSFVKKKSEKSLLLRLCLEFFDLVSPICIMPPSVRESMPPIDSIVVYSDRTSGQSIDHSEDRAS
jgi:hypothetical protein